ncbi:MAG: hypothetical protein Q4E05_11690 [Pseudoclavibacter sp.]|nr:hypothetical protein [Pseudoclavibacter sp.]
MHAAVMLAATLLAGGLAGFALDAAVSAVTRAAGAPGGANLTNAFLLGLAYLFGGSLSVTNQGGFGTIDLSLFGAPWGLVCLTALPVAVWGFIGERRSRTSGWRVRLALCAAPAVLVGLLYGLLTIGARTSLSVAGLFTVDVSTRTPLAPLAAITVLLLAAFAGRLLAALSADVPRPLPALLTSWRRLPWWLREPGIALAALLLVFGVLAPVLFAIPMNGGQLPRGSGPILLVLFSGQAWLATIVLGRLGAIGVHASVSGEQESRLMWAGNTADGFALLLVLLALATAVFVGTVLGLARRTDRIVPARAALHIGLALLGWALASLLLGRVAVNGEVGFLGAGGDLSLSLAPTGWSFLVMGLWACASEGLALLMPRVLASAPRLVRVLGAIGAGAGAAAAVPSAAPAAAPGARSPQGAQSAAPVFPGAEQPVSAPSHAGAMPPEAAAAQLGRTAPDPVGTAPFAAPAPAQDGAPQPLSRRAKRRLFLALGVVGALVFAAIAVPIAIGAVNRANGPLAAVHQYLDAIAAGEASRANELVDPNVPNDQREFLTDETLAAATERIQVLDVREEQQGSGGDRSQDALREITAVYRLGGVEHTAVLTTRRGENTAIFFENWRVETPLVGAARIAAEVDGPYTIGATGFELTEQHAVDPSSFGYGDAKKPRPAYQREVVLYPGSYPFTATDNEYFSYEPTSVTVTGPEGAEGGSSLPSGSTGGSGASRTTIDVTPTDALESAVSDAVEEMIDECAASNEASPEGCPFGAFVFGTNVSVEWSVDRYPSVKSLEPYGFRTSGGEMSYSASWSLAGSPGRRDGKEEVSEISGRISYRDGKIEIRFSGE